MLPQKPEASRLSLPALPSWAAVFKGVPAELAGCISGEVGVAA